MYLQIQSVIYKNRKDSLFKAIKAVKRAIEVCYDSIGFTGVKLIYGDASPEPILNDVDVKEIKEILGSIISFDYIFFGFNSGTSKGHNRLCSDSCAEYIMIMNPDIILETRCVERLMKTILKHKNAAMAEARQIPLEHPKLYDFKTGETEWSSTACVIFTLESFNEVEGFDEESFFMYCDDLDFSWRLRLRGYKIYYVPSAMAYHSKKLSMEGNWKPTDSEVYYSTEAAMLLAYKWSWEELAYKMLNNFKINGNKLEKRAANEFDKRIKDGKLPNQLDAEHRIAKYDNWSPYKTRFMY